MNSPRHNPVSGMSGFVQFALDAELLKSMHAAGIVKPTPYQTTLIPPILSGRDVIAHAASGEELTDAYLPAVCQRALSATPSAGVNTLILAASRKDSDRIADRLEEIAAFLNVTTARIYGGVGYAEQSQTLSHTPSVVTGMPGRIADHIRQKNLKIDALQTVILDDVEAMISLGFRRDMEFILKNRAESCGIVVLSESIPKRLKPFIDGFVTSPVTIPASSFADPSSPEPVASTAPPVPAPSKKTADAPRKTRKTKAVKPSPEKAQTSKKTHPAPNVPTRASQPDAAPQPQSARTANRKPPAKPDSGESDPGIDFSYYVTSPADTNALIMKLFDDAGAKPAVTFTRSIESARERIETLRQSGIDARLTPRPSRRSRGGRGRKNNRPKMLIATDEHDTDINTPDIALIIHADIPAAPDQFIGRINRIRTKRDIEKSIMLIAPSDGDALTEIELRLSRQMTAMKKFDSLESRFYPPKNAAAISATPDANRRATASKSKPANESSTPATTPPPHHPPEKSGRRPKTASAPAKTSRTPHSDSASSDTSKSTVKNASSEKPARVRRPRKKKRSGKDEAGRDMNVPVKAILADLNGNRRSAPTPAPEDETQFDPYDVMEDMAAALRDDTLSTSKPDAVATPHRPDNVVAHSTDSTPHPPDSDDPPAKSTGVSRAAFGSRRHDKKHSRKPHRRWRRQNGNVQVNPRHSAPGADDIVETFGKPFLSVTEAETPAWDQETVGLDWMIWENEDVESTPDHSASPVLSPEPTGSGTTVTLADIVSTIQKTARDLIGEVIDVVPDMEALPEAGAGKISVTDGTPDMSKKGRDGTPADDGILTNANRERTPSSPKRSSQAYSETLLNSICAMIRKAAATASKR